MQATLEPPDLLDFADLSQAVRQQMLSLPPTPRPAVIRPADIGERDDELLSVEYEPKPASEPTTARPGTKQKVEVLRARVELGETLWHPLDDDTPPEPCSTSITRLPNIREVKILVEVA